MKLQFGQNQLVLELSNSPFAWFHGQTERMSLTSLSLMFVQFSAVCPSAGCLMQLGRATSVSINLSRSPLGFFSGSTCRMSMFSLTLLFIEFRVLRRTTASLRLSWIDLAANFQHGLQAARCTVPERHLPAICFRQLAHDRQPQPGPTRGL